MEFTRFLIVGILNTLFGYSVYGIAIYLGLYFGYALLFATIIGILFNYKTNKTLVFKSKRKNVLFRFIMIYGFIYAINYYGIVCIMFIGYNNYISALIILPFSAVLSYMLNKRIVFKNEKIN